MPKDKSEAKPKPDDKKIVKTEPQSLVAPGGGGRGFEDMEIEDLIIPYAKLTQPLSPEVQEEDSSIKAGAILNSLTSYSYKKPLKFIPLMFRKRRIKWFPRETGGGMECASIDAKRPDVGSLLAPKCSVCEWAQWSRSENEENVPPDCNLFYVFPSIVLGLPDQDNKLIAISFGRTNFQTGKRLVNIARMGGGDIFTRPYQLTTKKETNDKGTYWVFGVDIAGKLTKAEFKEAEGYFNMLNSMRFKIDEEQPPDEDEDKVPF